MPAHFTLHVRLTKHCNASCSYCSSHEPDEALAERMTPERYLLALDFIKKIIQKTKLGGDGGHLSINYIGGELLTLPCATLKKWCLAGANVSSPCSRTS